MVERLTKKISETIQDKYSLGSYLYYDFAEIDDTNQLLNKLGKLEDILEKYGVESMEELDFRLAFKQNDVFNYKVVTELEQERDAWKRACELACEREDDCYVYDNIHRAYEFYQQAKKEGNDE